MAHVFISYKREDIVFAKELEDQLRKAQFEVWRDQQIPGGKKWLEEIELKLHESFVVVVAVTPEAIKSEWINYEWIFAHGAGIEIVPIHLKTVKKFPCRLNDYQLVDFRSEHSWERLIEQILGIDTEKTIQKSSDPFMTIELLEQFNILRNNTNEYKRKQAAIFLGNTGEEHVIPSLVAALEDQNKMVRIAAMDALDKVGIVNDLVVNGLAARLGDDSESNGRKISAVAEKMLLNFATPETQTAVDKWKQGRV